MAHLDDFDRKLGSQRDVWEAGAFGSGQIEGRRHVPAAGATPFCYRKTKLQ